MPLINGLLISAIVLLGYTWVAYPLLLAVFARLFDRRPLTSDLRSPSEASAKEGPPISDLPYLHIILSAYNEEDVIAARLENLTQMDYPDDRITVHIGTDGCTDRTAEIIREFWEEGRSTHGLTQIDTDGGNGLSLFLHEFTENRGKPAVLKDLVAAAIEQIKSCGRRDSSPVTLNSLPREAHLLIFTDANTMFRPDALRKLVYHFADPDTGGVCGRLILHSRLVESAPNPRSSAPARHSLGEGGFIGGFSLPSSAPEGTYWGFETKLKTWESTLDSCLGANGAIYAIRPESFWQELPANTVVDDFVIGMKVREQGMRMVYDPEAIATEELPEQKAEWKRRVRIGSGDYQALSFCRRCLRPSFGWFAWSFWSHKVLRWFTPHIMLFAASAAIVGSTLARIQESGVRIQVFMCDIVSAGSLLAILLWGAARVVASSRPLGAQRRSAVASSEGGQLRSIAAPLRLVDHFLTMQVALLAGFFRYIRGNLGGAWVRTPRS